MKTSTGNYSTGDWSTGNYSTGYCSTGDWSTGDWSTGYWSTGYCSTGNYSTGDCSTGYWSTGYCSTGNYSTGDCSTGYWSISNYSTGHFSTKDYDGFGAFNKPCTIKEWNNSMKPDFLYFDLTEWIYESEMTDKEKENHPEVKTTGGYLKVYGYKEAWRKSFDAQENIKEQIKQLEALPNFDYDVFVEISGIDYRNESDEVDITVEGKTKRISRKSAEALGLL